MGPRTLPLRLFGVERIVESLRSHARTIGGSIELEQVKVLDRPNAGKEGFC